MKTLVQWKRFATLVACGVALVASTAQAELLGTFNWVAYDNLAGTMYTEGGNVNAITWDADRPGSHNPSGTLIDYASGNATGATMYTNDGYSDSSAQSPSPYAGSYLWADGSGVALTPGTAAEIIFGDVLTGYANGNKIAHQNPPPTSGAAISSRTQQYLRFTGLDPTKTYTFAGGSDAKSRYRNDGGHPGFSHVDLVGADSAVNNSLLTSITAAAYTPGNGYANSGLSSVLTYENDDLVRYDGINPGSDGEFGVLLYTSHDQTDREWFPAFNASVLAEDGGPAVPEPTSIALIVLGAVGLLALRRRRR